MIPESFIQKFRESLRGQSFYPGEQGYDAARTLPNAMIDRRPAIIARCSGAADVIACVRFAREHDLVVSVRGGGHSIAGKAVCDGGLMVDLSGMKGIRVDPVRRTVRADGSAVGRIRPRDASLWTGYDAGCGSKSGNRGPDAGRRLGTLARKIWTRHRLTLLARTWSLPMGAC
jgi:hypothetical protein